MNFHDLHELLRLELLRRIKQGALTGTNLAKLANFRQGHISNFLNRKRFLSLDGMDRLLAAQNLTIDQLIPLVLSAASSVPATHEFESIPVVSATTAMQEAVLNPDAVIEPLHPSAPQLQHCRAQPSPQRAHWQRFVAVRADRQQAAAMEPMLADGSMVVLDRHYTSLAPYRAQQRTLLAVRSGSGLVFRYVEFEDTRLILRPLALAYPIQLLTISPHQTPADYIVGRVCMIVSEL